MQHTADQPLVAGELGQGTDRYGKSKPDVLNYGSSGVGGAGHLGGELLASMAGLQMVHVPYKGGGLVLADLISGQIQLGFTSTISGMPHVRSGRLKGLAMTSPKRAQAFPELPTLAEAGVPGFELINWYGLFGPAGTHQRSWRCCIATSVSR